MKLLLAALLLASASAHATDYLSISAGGKQTTYTGSLIHLESEGLGGTIVLDALWPGQITSSDEDGPSQTGTWKIIVRQDDGTSEESTLQCSAHVSFASTCGTLRLTCVNPPATALKNLGR